MDAKIVNAYNDGILLNKGLKGGWGNSFHITVGDRQVFFDVGYRGGILMQNIRALGIDVNNVEKLVLSHAHRDHTGGLVDFLKARTTATKLLPIIAHPDVKEQKSIKMFIFYLPLGLPRLSERLLRDVSFEFAKNPTEILPRLSTLGEIPTPERTEKMGIASKAFHKVNGHRMWDPVVDDLSLVLQTKDGLVLIMGCCHAGLLNTCAHATKLFNKKIKTLIGGTHMLEYTDEDVQHVGALLENTYGTPEIYLNHCTGEKAISQLKARFGKDKVHDCYVGSELTFEV